MLLAAALLIGSGLAVRPAAANPPPGAPGAPAAAPLDSLRAPPKPDTIANVVEVGRVRPPVTRTAVPTTVPRFGEPRYVMMRSLILPGWGQLYNRSWIKATLFGGIEWGLITALVRDEQQLKKLSRQADEAQAAHDETAFDAAVNAYNDRLSGSTNRRWLLGGMIAYAAVDAYVDAHFRNFDVEFGPDPALPPDLRPDKDQGKGKGKGGGGGGGGGRLSLRWTF